jgi:hypothetical protein
MTSSRRLRDDNRVVSSSVSDGAWRGESTSSVSPDTGPQKCCSCANATRTAGRVCWNRTRRCDAHICLFPWHHAGAEHNPPSGRRLDRPAALIPEMRALPPHGATRAGVMCVPADGPRQPQDIEAGARLRLGYRPGVQANMRASLRLTAVSAPAVPALPASLPTLVPSLGQPWRLRDA